jgi:hypothetical protein
MKPIPIFKKTNKMAISRSAAIVLVVMIGAACGASLSSNTKPMAGKPSLMAIAKQVFADREGAAVERQAVEQDSYLEALEYSQNSAALQGEGGGIGGFFRSVVYGLHYYTLINIYIIIIIDSTFLIII